jgi:hypothetical protein
MPAAAAAYQRILVDGVPFWKENATGALYYYESAAPPVEGQPNRICLGAESSGLFADWQTKLASALETYRTAAAPRARA